jgi:hypothetical protein
MESPEDIEKALGRLMPAAISERGQRALEGTIDGLAAGGISAPAKSSPRSGWWTAAVAIPTAAAAALTVALVMSKGVPSKSGEVVQMPKDAPAELSASDVSGAKKPMSVNGDLPGEVPAYNLDHRKNFVRPNGTIRIAVEAGGNDFVITNPDGTELFHGSLDDPAFPAEWKGRAKGIQHALQESSDDKAPSEQ